jgi:hypothetical protein
MKSTKYEAPRYAVFSLCHSPLKLKSSPIWSTYIFQTIHVNLLLTEIRVRCYKKFSYNCHKFYAFKSHQNSRAFNMTLKQATWQYLTKKKKKDIITLQKLKQCYLKFSQYSALLNNFPNRSSNNFVVSTAILYIKHYLFALLLKFYTVTAIPMLLYGSECWTLMNEQMGRKQTTDRNTFRFVSFRQGEWRAINVTKILEKNWE